MLYPSWYILKGITDYKPRHDGGSFGDIYSGKQGSLELCLKVMRLTRDEVDKTFKVHTDSHSFPIARTNSLVVRKLYAKEAIVWGQLRHPNIVHFYGIFYLDEAKEKICLVSPWMDNGNIEVYLKKKPEAPRKPLVSLLFVVSSPR